jgi:hypothetical protein
MRPTFYPTLFKGVSARYLTEADFPNTTTLYGWRAGNSNVLDTVYGGISLSDDGSDGYTSSTDHIGNTVYCDSAADYNHYNVGSLSGTTNQSFSVFAWVYCENWATNETAGFLLSYFIDGLNFSQFNIGIYQGDVIVFCTDSSAGDDTDSSYTTGFTGSGWHSICVTRNVSTTYTKIYIDGELKDSTNKAFSFTYDFDKVYPFNIDCKTTENWCHFDTVLTDEQVAALHAIGVAA